MLAMGLPALALHLFSIALTKALRSYSRSLLQERCEARGHPERADAVAHLGQRTERSAAALPLTFGLRQVERLVEWSTGLSESAQRPASVEVEFPSEEEVSEDVEPELPESARVLLQHAVELTRTDVAEIMTPRPLIVSLPATVSAEAAAATFRQSGLSPVPIFGANHDDIVGILYAKDLFARMTEVTDFHAVIPRKLVRPAHFVPETKNAFEL